MKKKTAHRLLPCPAYDVESMESWLGDLAEQGLFLQKDGFFAGIASFDRGKPNPTRYRLEAAKKPVSFWKEGSDRPDPEAQELGDAYGWEYVATLGQFFVYRNDIPGQRELNTDPAVQAISLKLLQKRQWSDFAGTLFWVILYSLLWIKGGILELALSMGSLRFLLMTVLILWGFGTSLTTLISLGKFRRKLASGQPANHKKSWKKRAWLHRAELFGFLILCLALIGTSLSRWNADLSDADWRTLSEDPGPFPFSTLSDLAEEGTYRLEVGYLSNRSKRSSNFLAPEIIEYRETGSGRLSNGEAFSGGLTLSYYRLSSPVLAKELYRELFREGKHQKHYAPLEASDLNAEQWATYREYFPTLLLQKGDVVLKVSFFQIGESEVPLQQWAEIFAKNLDSIRSR